MFDNLTQNPNGLFPDRKFLTNTIQNINAKMDVKFGNHPMQKGIDLRVTLASLASFSLLSYIPRPFHPDTGRAGAGADPEPL